MDDQVCAAGISSLAKVYRKRYTFVMSYYDDIYEYAANNYGLITSADAKGIGVPNVELVKLAGRGRLTRLGHGVYRIEHYVPTPLDKYAEAVVQVGHGAYIFGESVLAMHGLALVNPSVIYTATTKVPRKKLPPYVVNILRRDGDDIVNYEGIPTQSVRTAILASTASVMTERLKDATTEAKKQGLISEAEATMIIKEIKENVHTEQP
jgi:predicted transcriptional regulator of viral defense system